MNQTLDMNLPQLMGKSKDSVNSHQSNAKARNKSEVQYDNFPDIAKRLPMDDDVRTPKSRDLRKSMRSKRSKSVSKNSVPTGVKSHKSRASKSKNGRYEQPLS